MSDKEEKSNKGKSKPRSPAYPGIPFRRSHHTCAPNLPIMNERIKRTSLLFIVIGVIKLRVEMQELH